MKVEDGLIKYMLSRVSKSVIISMRPGDDLRSASLVYFEFLIEIFSSCFRMAALVSNVPLLNVYSNIFW